MSGRLARCATRPAPSRAPPHSSREFFVYPFLRRSVQRVIVTGGLAALVLELAGAAAAVAMTVVALVAPPVTGRPLRWPTSRGPSSLTEVPTQRPSSPGS